MEDFRACENQKIEKLLHLELELLVELEETGFLSGSGLVVHDFKFKIEIQTIYLNEKSSYKLGFNK